MRQMTFGRIFEDFLVPLILYGFFSYYIMRHAVKSFRILRELRRNGVTVPASVIGYTERILSRGKLKQKQYCVNVVCKSPKDGVEKSYILGTCSSKGMRYEKLSQTDVIFISPDAPAPLLPEELRTIRRVRIVSLCGGIFCLLFCLLIIFGMVLYITD